MHTHRTLLLDNATWDITLDGAGRIALAAGPQAVAQNVANEARLFTEDAYFIQDQGIPHFFISLGRRGNNAALRSYLRRAASRVPGVQEVLEVRIDNFTPAARTLKGEIHFINADGARGRAGFSTAVQR